jgi:hypothetical protein
MQITLELPDDVVNRRRLPARGIMVTSRSIPNQRCNESTDMPGWRRPSDLRSFLALPEIADLKVCASLCCHVVLESLY